MEEPPHRKDRRAGDLLEIEKVISTKAPDAVTPMTDLRQGDLTKASALAESLAGSAPNDPVIQNLLGSVRLAQKRLPEAEAIFRGILDKNRDFTPAAFNLVQVLVAEQRQDGRIRPFLIDQAETSRPLRDSSRWAYGQRRRSPR
jgi:predicted Zn-dependent protease